MVCSHDESFIQMIRRYKFHGMDKDAWSRYKKMESPVVEVMTPGYKHNLPDIQAALGITQLRKLDRFNKRRAELVKLYDEYLKGIAELLPLGRPTYPHTHSWHLYIVFLDIKATAISRNKFMEELKKRNVGTGLHFYAAHLHHYYRENLNYKRGMLPNTEWASDCLFSLPLYPSMQDEDVRYVVDAIKDIIANRDRG